MALNHPPPPQVLKDSWGVGCIRTGCSRPPRGIGHIGHKLLQGLIEVVGSQAIASWAKHPTPPGGWVGGYRDGWVGWPQISAFWATRHPPRVRERFWGVLGLCRALRSA